MYRSTASTLAGCPRIQDGIVANTTGWRDSTPLPADLNVVTTAVANGAVRLPPAKAGIGTMVVNASTQTSMVWGYSNQDTIGQGAKGAGLAVPPGGADFTCVRDGQWGVIPGLAMVVPKSELAKPVTDFIDEPRWAPGEEPEPEPVQSMLWEYPVEEPPPEPTPTAT